VEKATGSRLVVSIILARISNSYDLAGIMLRTLGSTENMKNEEGIGIIHYCSVRVR
jgi:hypothetical protein